MQDEAMQGQKRMRRCEANCFYRKFKKNIDLYVKKK
jgi:hypothetical protein